MNIVDPVMERQQPDKTLFIAGSSGSTAVELWQYNLHVTGNSPPGRTVVLPNVGEAEGREYIIAATVPTGTGNTGSLINVIYSNGGATSLSTAINTTGVELSLKAIGGTWRILRST